MFSAAVDAAAAAAAIGFRCGYGTCFQIGIYVQHSSGISETKTETT